MTRINWSITAAADAGGLSYWFNGAIGVIASLVFMPLLASLSCTLFIISVRIFTQKINVVHDWLYRELHIISALYIIHI